MGVVDQGDPITVDVTGDEGEVVLLNADGDVVDGPIEIDDQRSTEQMTFETTNLEPGSYALVIETRGSDFEAVYPVVVSGYDIDVTHSDTVEADDEIEIDVTVSQQASQTTPGSVQVAVWDDDTVVRTDATHDSGDSYSATVSASEFDVGTEYNVYAVAQGTEKVDLIGEEEILGVSDESTVKIVESGGDDDPPADDDEPANGDDESDDDEGSDDDDESDDGSDDDDSDDSDGTDDPAGDDEGTADDGDDGSSSDTIGSDDGDTDSSEDEDDTPDNVVQPNQDDGSGGDDAGSGEEPSSDSIPMSGLSLILVGSIAIALFVQIRD
ncbi:hypothetical protein [Natrarchaeobius chitinivorans]|uniref:Uncharacterized protein n=1 Tax=Natrarchaeobius chitinivorans TaxID=1679083 RepID=A0A3N6LYU1_NATCH|nr:hypothetical protein [Natrarchaeobius chitinivorans]RQG96018.1 hypothetical protein EA473_07540 [Natrarchaeobius chitinivorans]